MRAARRVLAAAGVALAVAVVVVAVLDVSALIGLALGLSQ